MSSRILIRLSGGEAEQRSLERLQCLFAEVCNRLWLIVKSNRCWNRVTLHHLAYHEMRASYPELGSQMLCNAIYSVCRTARVVLQAPSSPWNLAKYPDRSIPTISFAASCPVYFDRHTLSVRGNELSLYTLEGRVHFRAALGDEDGRRFADEKIKEIVLARDAGGYFLKVSFGDGALPAAPDSSLPEYLVIQN